MKLLNKLRKAKPSTSNFMIVDATMIEEIVKQCNDNPNLKVTYHTLEGNSIDFTVIDKDNSSRRIKWDA